MKGVHVKMFEKRKRKQMFEEKVWYELGEIQCAIIEQKLAIRSLEKSIEELKALCSKEEES